MHMHSAYIHMSEKMDISITNIAGVLDINVGTREQILGMPFWGERCRKTLYFSLLMSR